MILKMYSVRDRQVGAYSKPVFDVLEPADLAEQFRRAIIQDPALNKQLAYSELYYLGTYDDKTADFVLISKPEFVDDLSQYFVEVSKNG